jgi:hypothetical protein
MMNAWLVFQASCSQYGTNIVMTAALLASSPFGHPVQPVAPPRPGADELVMNRTCPDLPRRPGQPGPLWRKDCERRSRRAHGVAALRHLVATFATWAPAMTKVTCQTPHLDWVRHPMGAGVRGPGPLTGQGRAIVAAIAAGDAALALASRRGDLRPIFASPTHPLARFHQKIDHGPA